MGGGLTQEGAGDVLGDLVPGAAGLRELRQLPAQHPLELRAAGRAQRAGRTLLPPPAGGSVARGTLTLLEAISPTERRVCSVSSWSRHQSSSSRVSRESFWWASSAGDTHGLGTGCADGTGTRTGSWLQHVPCQAGGWEHRRDAGKQPGPGPGLGLKHPWVWGSAPSHRPHHTQRAPLAPWGDSQAQGSRRALLMLGFINGRFDVNRSLPTTGGAAENQTWIPKDKAPAQEGPCCTPKGPAGPIRRDTGIQGQTGHHRSSIPPSPPALTGEAGLAPGGQAAARSPPVEHGGGSADGTPMAVPPLPWVRFPPPRQDPHPPCPVANSLDAGAVLEVGQVAPDRAETGQDLGGARGS